MTCKKFCSAARCNRVGRVGSSFEGTRKYLKSSLASLSSIISVSRLIYMQIAVQLISLEFTKFNTSIYIKNGPQVHIHVNLDGSFCQSVLSLALTEVGSDQFLVV